MSISSVNGVASTVSRYRFVAAGGETSLTGSDANGATLSYLVGKEEVYLNGALLVRGQDYTGTDGATISSLTALVAGDTVEIITFVPFAIPTAISSATVTTQGDLIVATGASAVTRLGVGSSGQILTSNGTTPAYTSTVTGTLNNGTLTGTLTAASSAGTSGQLLSSTGTGVQWVAAPASGSYTQITTGTLSSTSVNITSIPQTYKNLVLTVYGAINATNSTTLFYQYNGVTSGDYSYSGFPTLGSTTTTGTTASQIPFGWIGTSSADPSAKGLASIVFPNYSLSSPKVNNSVAMNTNNITQNIYWGTLGTNNAAITSIQILVLAGSFASGTYTLYGVN